MNRCLALLLVGLLSVVEVVSGAVTTRLRFPMGENGSLGANHMPLDAVGGYHLQAQINGGATTLLTSGLGADGSTAALRFNGLNQGFYGNGGDMMSVIGTDNFGVELWVRTPNIIQENYDFIFSLTGDVGAATGPAIHLANGRWSASIPGYQWIGGSPFDVGGGVPAVANVWTRLAVVRTSGVFRLYVNGVAHPQTTTAPPVGMNGFHMAVNPGGAVYFEGDLDEVRLFTFAAGAFNPATDLYQPPAPPVLDFSGQAVISELAASGTGEVDDEDGSRQDWIELQNPTTAHVQLAGWRLSDDPLIPAKWTFPATVIPPGGHLLVFASGKNRALAGGELHTNFSLDPDGEFLSLTRPDGSVASAFTWPRQKIGASWGQGRILDAQLITPSSMTKFKAMNDDSLGLAWTQPDFSDSSWTSATAAIGYDDGVDDGSGLSIQGYWKFDSVGTAAVDSSLRGMNGALVGTATFTADGGGHSGLLGDRALDLGTGGGYVTWNQAAGGAFDAISENNKISLSVWTYGGATAPTQGYLFNLGSQNDGGGERAAFAHLPWTDQNIYWDTGGCCGGDTRMHKLEPDTTKWKGQWNHYVFLKDGPRKEIWQNGVLWHSASNIAPISLIRSFLVGVSQPGLIDELALWAGALTPAQIQALAARTATPTQLNVFSSAVQQNVRTAMHGLTPSAMLRVPFTLASTPTWDELRLRVRFDDGFVAYLNGVEVARRNAPANAAYNSLAITNRSKGEVLGIPADIDITSAMHLLRTDGQTNVLAIHGLNDNITSPEFFLEPLLMAYRRPIGRHFSPPTPGEANGPGYADYVRDTTFSVNRGFYDTPQTTTISSPTLDSTLHYTLNGTMPGPGNPASTAASAAPGGTPTVTLNITGTTIVRAIATRADWMPTNADTHSYLFPNQIAAQPATPPGVPATWGVYGGYGPRIGQPMVADYAMDQRIVTGAQQGHTVRDALLALPAVCLSLPAEDLFDANTGMYSNSPQQGPTWSRAASMEFIYPDGTRGNLQAGIGLRIHGGLSRQHWHSPKHSFTLMFKSEFGTSKLEHKLFEDTPVRQWDELVLRASSTDSWTVEDVGSYEYPNSRASYMRDPWMKDSFAAMGHPTGHSRYVHLFLNGLYWGQYNLAEAYVESWHAEMFGGTEEEYDVVKDLNELESGSRTDWDAALTLAAAGFPDDAAFYRIQGRNPDGTRNPALPIYLDMANLIDYMILHIYATARDWPVHNWWGGRRRGAASEGFKFYPWDQEISNLNLAWVDTYSGGARFEEVNSAGTPAAFYDTLRLNARFRREFGDRVQALCFGNGPLTPAACQARWLVRQAQMDKSIVAESARWGDARQATPYTREANWLPEMNWVANTWWAGNHPQALQRFRRVSLFPSVIAPTMSQQGGNIPAGFQLTLTAPAGSIYYTTNGKEPISLTGVVAPEALLYSGPITLGADAVVKARVRSAGSMSALVSGTFVVAAPASHLNLVVSELHYNPVPGGYEFIELMNTSPAVIDLSGVTLSDAVAFTFPAGTRLNAGERLIVTESGGTFPAAVRNAGAYAGKLANSGEHLSVTAANGAPILSLSWTDAAPWPVEADGIGSSLTLMRPGTHPDAQNPLNWRNSIPNDGTPGTTDATTFSGNQTADLDNDGLSALLEYALGTSDSVPNGTPITVEPYGTDFLITIPWNGAAEDITLTPEYSTQLTTWTPAMAQVFATTATTRTWQVTLPDGPRSFIRVNTAQ